MKKLYVQPEFDLVKFSSTEDILDNSLERVDVEDLLEGKEEEVLDNGNTGYKDLVDDDDSTIVDEWA